MKYLLIVLALVLSCSNVTSDRVTETFYDIKLDQGRVSNCFFDTESYPVTCSTPFFDFSWTMYLVQGIPQGTFTIDNFSNGTLQVQFIEMGCYNLISRSPTKLIIPAMDHVNFVIQPNSAETFEYALTSPFVVPAMLTFDYSATLFELP